jgi:16S rRNA (cytosine1402-N4)-methyltransferase
MRMDRTQPFSARDWVAETPEDEMAQAFRRYGEEPRARRIAAAIARERDLRPIDTTAQLAALVARSKGVREGSRGPGRLHPATQVFQAIRIAVNDELRHLEQALEDATALLTAGGRLVAISFHSLEDRIVKQVFTRHVGRMVSLQQGGEEWEGTTPRMRWVVRKPAMAGREEMALNPRSRSAKLRAVERIEA